MQIIIRERQAISVIVPVANPDVGSNASNSDRVTLGRIEQPHLFALVFHPRPPQCVTCAAPQPCVPRGCTMAPARLESPCRSPSRRTTPRSFALYPMRQREQVIKRLGRLGGAAN